MRTHVRKKSTILLLLLAAAIGVTPAIVADVPQKPATAAELRRAQEFIIALDMGEEPFTFNPQRSTNVDSAQMFTALTEGLVTYHPATLQPIPGVAEQLIPSSDGKTWTFKIRKNARFSNGDPITAETFLDTWFHLIRKETQGDMASLLDIIKGVRDYRTGVTRNTDKVGIRAVDSHTLVLTLTTPAPYLLNILCHHIFVPIHPDNLAVLESLGPDNFISSGPFVIASHDETSYVLEPNPFYWDAGNVRAKRIRLELRDSDVALLIDFMNGKIHWSEAYVSIPLLFDQDPVIVYPEYSTGFYYFSDDSGPYADARVRRAMALLVPWNEIREDSRYLFPTSALVPKDSEYLGAEGITQANRDEAMSLLAEAGFPNGKGLPQFSIAIHPGTALEEMTDRITDIWGQELGITTIIDVVPFSVYLGDPENSPYSMGYITWIGDFYDPYSFLNLWLSDSSFNLGKYRDPEYDSLIRNGLKQADKASRFIFFREAEEILLQQAAVLPVSHGVSVNFVHLNMTDGWYPNFLNIHPYKYLSLREPTTNDDTL